MKQVKTKTIRSGRWSAETSPVPLRPYEFPDEFVFGAATSAYQIEGGIDAASGRGRSIWEPYFEKRPGSDTGEIACDHYNRMPEDVRLFKKMGLQAYRFSVAWPRVLPQGTGAVNDKGLDFYKRLVDELLAAGIEPYLTGYHWDLPQALEERGGWTSRDTAKHFGEYMDLLARTLGDRVKYWGTLNEPAVVLSGYTSEGLAPGRNDPKLWAPVVHNLMLAHGHGAAAIRSVNPELIVGCTVNLVPIEPANKSARHAARRLWQRDYAVFMDAMLKGEYPKIVRKEMEASGLQILPGDMELIGSGLDYLGVNWYLRLVVNRLGRVIPVPAAEITQVGWEMHAESLTSMLVAMQEEYELPPIFITENGAAIDDKIEGAWIHDTVRMKYIHDHLNALESAIARGVDVRGYFAWSALDNLEWASGFRMTFGLVHVDRKTLKRTLKDSAYWYRDMININQGSNAA